MPQARILIVDDNTPFRHLLVAFLRKADFATIEAADGQEALDILEEDQPKAILLDLQMEPLGGFGFMEEYMERGYTIPVILVTGDGSNDILVRASKMGFSGVLQKPVTESRVISILQRTLSTAS